MSVVQRFALCAYIVTQHISSVAVVFREVVFRPFTSEVILAKVKSSDEDGIRCASQYSSSFLSRIHSIVSSNCGLF